MADYQNAREGVVSLYLINATKKPISVPTQDGDLFCKREVKIAQEEWRRCDSHHFSWCGNSYIPKELPAGGYLTWKQVLNCKSGKESTIRFRMFSDALNDLISNEGTGQVADSSIQLCRYDAMAMHLGPFEDVVAVATGKVVGGQGAGMEEMNAGMEALSRFPDEDGLFDVIKKCVSNLSSDDNWGDHHYRSCLEALYGTSGRTVSPQDSWDYVFGHASDPDFKWAGVALDWLVNHFPARTQELEKLVEQILSKPSHRALRSALHHYPKIGDKSEVGKKLLSILADQAYSEEVHEAAREVREEFFENPFLEIHAETGASFSEPSPPVLEVTIYNISPQEITLPAAKVQDLLCYRLVSSGANLDVKADAETAPTGNLTLRHGESITVKNVRWWEKIDPTTLRDDASYMLITKVATPGLWDVHAKNGSWPSYDGKVILEAIRRSKSDAALKPAEM